MSRKKFEVKLVVRVTRDQYEKLEKYSQRKARTVSQTIREYIHRLPGAREDDQKKPQLALPPAKGPEILIDATQAFSIYAKQKRELVKAGYTPRDAGPCDDIWRADETLEQYLDRLMGCDPKNLDFHHFVSDDDLED